MTLSVDGKGYADEARPVEPGDNREQHRKAMADIDQIVVIHDFSEPRGGAGLLAAARYDDFRARKYRNADRARRNRDRAGLETAPRASNA